ncbi:MAG: PepSY domain-containing protein [Novosphingobium sp.]|nr:PepSY domain-containing protein [Novosphingobium sp.]
MNPQSVVLAGKKAPKPRSRWWRLHAWLGLKLSVFLTVILLSGTLAVIGNEIDWLADPAMRASPGRQSQASWGTIAGNALAAVPGGRIELIERGPDPWFATVVVMKAPDGHRRRVLVDPATGTINRVAGFGGAQRFLRDFHRRLMLPVAIGLPLVTGFAFVLLASLVSGLVTYKKFWRGFLRRPRWRDWRTASGDLHRLAGLWSLWFLSLVIVTSLWYLVELLGASAPVLFPLDPAPQTGRAQAQPVGEALDRLAERARESFPDLDIRRVQYPFPGVGAVGFQGEAQSWLTTEKANAVWVEPDTSRVVARIEGQALSAHQRISEMADPLHFGTWGGLASKIVWFLCGCLLTGLAVTGIIIYASRLRGAWGVAARGVSWWGLVGCAFVVGALLMAPSVLLG